MNGQQGGEAQIPASLELKVQSYENKVREALYRDGSSFGLRLQTADALLADMGAILRYKNEAPHLTEDGFNEVRAAAAGQQNLFGKDSFLDAPAVAKNLPLYMVIESYFRAEVIAEQLRLLTDGSLDLEAAECSALWQKLFDFLQESPLLTLKLIGRKVKLVFEDFPEHLQVLLTGGGASGGDIYRLASYYTFLSLSATFTKASAGELMSIEAPDGVDKEAAVLGAMKTAREYRKDIGKKRVYSDRSQTEPDILRASASLQAEQAAGIEPEYMQHQGGVIPAADKHLAGGDDSEGAKLFRVWDNVASTFRRQLAVSAADKQYSGTLRSIAEQNGIGETILYTCFAVIQRIAQDNGMVQVNKMTGQSFHYYRMTLEKLGLLAYGRHARSWEIAELFKGFRVLDGHLFPIEERAVIKEKIGKGKKEFKTEYKRFTKEVKLFSIEQRIRASNPEDIIPETTIVDLGINSFIVEGRTRSESIQGEKEGQYINILKSRLHLLTEEQEAAARRIFKGSPAAHRFYYMLMSLTNLSEDKMIDQLFDLSNYYGNLAAAEENLHNYYGELKAAGKTAEALSENEAQMIDKLKDERRQALNGIKTARYRCRKKIEELFAAAKEGGLLKWYKRTDANPNTKKHGNEKASVWKWERIEKHIAKEEAEEQNQAEA